MSGTSQQGTTTFTRHIILQLGKATISFNHLKNLLPVYFLLMITTNCVDIRTIYIVIDIDISKATLDRNLNAFILNDLCKYRITQY